MGNVKVGAYDPDTGYMMCYCGQLVCTFHKECLELRGDSYGIDKNFDGVSARELAHAEEAKKK